MEQCFNLKSFDKKISVVSSSGPLLMAALDLTFMKTSRIHSSAEIT